MIYNVQAHLKQRLRLVRIEMCVLRFGHKLNEEVCHGFIFANLFNSLYLEVRLWRSILVTNLETNFQDLVCQSEKFRHIGACIRRNFMPCFKSLFLVSLVSISHCLYSWLNSSKGVCLETCCVFHECYIKDGSCKSHGKLLGLSRAKLQAPSSKPTITSPNFEVKIQCNILYSMELSLKNPCIVI